MDQAYGNAKDINLAEKHGTPEEKLFSFAEYRAEDAERIGYSEYSYWKSVFRNFMKKKSALVMTGVFMILFLFTFVGQAMGKYQIHDLRPDHTQMFISPGADYWFGTDNLGRDYWCQVWYAAEVSIKLAALVAVGEAILGVFLGCLWGYVKTLDRILEVTYFLINNVPVIIRMTLIALLVGQSFLIMAVALIAFGWLQMARNVRNLVTIYRDREYNLASRCLGTSTARILTKNILPYLISVIILRLALSIPQTIAFESTLSYLGLGLGIETPSLGILLRNARTSFLDFPYLLVFPAIIVSLITITFYLVGNAFSDAADPRNHV